MTITRKAKMSNEERLLKALLNGVPPDNVEIISRVDKYLSACCEKCGCDGLPEPVTRIDHLLYDLAARLKGAGSGGSGTGGASNVSFDSYINGTLKAVSSNVTAVVKYAFYNCSSIETVSLTEATILQNNAIQYCDKLTSVNLPKVETINSYGLANNAVLTNTTLPSVKTIADYGMSANYAIKTLEFTRITLLGNGAFANCTNLNKLIIRTETQMCVGGVNVLANTPIASGAGYIYVPDSLIDTYKADTKWSKYTNQIKGLSEL